MAHKHTMGKNVRQLVMKQSTLDFAWAALEKAEEVLRIVAPIKGNREALDSAYVRLKDFQNAVAEAEEAFTDAEEAKRKAGRKEGN